MNPYLIFAFGGFVGVAIGFLVAALCNMAHEGDKPVEAAVDEAERWARLQKEMGVAAARLKKEMGVEE